MQARPNMALRSDSIESRVAERTAWIDVYKARSAAAAKPRSPPPSDLLVDLM